MLGPFPKPHYRPYGEDAGLQIKLLGYLYLIPVVIMLAGGLWKQRPESVAAGMVALALPFFITLLTSWFIADNGYLLASLLQQGTFTTAILSVVWIYVVVMPSALAYSIGSILPPWAGLVAAPASRPRGGCAHPQGNNRHETDGDSAAGRRLIPRTLLVSPRTITYKSVPRVV